MNIRQRAMALRRQLAAGCGDSGCPFGPKGGMRTNGGCHCHEKVEDAIKQVLIELNEEVDGIFQSHLLDAMDQAKPSERATVGYVRKLVTDHISKVR